jgi:hypothetical protein
MHDASAARRGALQLDWSFLQGPARPDVGTRAPAMPLPQFEPDPAPAHPTVLMALRRSAQRDVEALRARLCRTPLVA